MLPSNRYQGQRDLLTSHGCGKGSADRTSNKRAFTHNFNEINWPASIDGFESAGPGRRVKHYGPAPKIVIH